MHELVELAAVGQLPFPQEINYFLVADLAGEIVDVVAGINELALVADDVAQSRRIGDDTFQATGNIPRLWRRSRFCFVQFGHGHFSESSSALHSRNECIRHCCWGFGYGNAGGLERFDFSLGCALATGDDGAGMPHTSAGWR